MDVSGEFHVSVALVPEKNAGTHWIGDCVCHRAAPEYFGRREIFFPLPRFKPRHAHGVASRCMISDMLTRVRPRIQLQKN